MSKRLEHMTQDAHDRCERVLARTFGGIHHVPAWPWRKKWGEGMALSVRDGLATFDFAALTRLVVAAHDECVRVEILSSAPGYVKLGLHPRTNRTGGEMWDRHPTMETAMEHARKTSRELTE